MAFASQEGTLSATGAEDNLVTGQTTDAVIQILVDVSEMAAGDVVMIRLYDEVISTGSPLLIEAWELAHEQTRVFVADLPLIALHNWAVTLEQTDGTNRDYDWSVREAL